MSNGIDSDTPLGRVGEPQEIQAKKIGDPTTYRTGDYQVTVTLRRTKVLEKFLEHKDTCARCPTDERRHETKTITKSHKFMTSRGLKTSIQETIKNQLEASASDDAASVSAAVSSQIASQISSEITTGEEDSKTTPMTFGETDHFAPPEKQRIILEGYDEYTDRLTASIKIVREEGGVSWYHVVPGVNIGWALGASVTGIFSGGEYVLGDPRERTVEVASFEMTFDADKTWHKWREKEDSDCRPDEKDTKEPDR